MLQIFFLLVAVNSYGVRAANCPDYWVGFHDACYYFGTGLAQPFFEAENFCRQHNAHLVHVETYAENIFIQSYLRDNKHGDSWIGLTDFQTEGRWEWYDTNTEASFTSWGPGEPDNDANQDCAQYREYSGYNWDDTWCTPARSQPICEIKSALVIVG